MEKIEHLPMIVEFRDAFSKEECDRLIEYFELASDDWAEFCFYGSFGMNPSLPIDNGMSDNFSLEDLNLVRGKMHNLAHEVTGEMLQNTAASAHKWVPGSFAEPHADNTDENGNPSSWRQNKYVAILYLNEEYDGGELYFVQHGIEIAPKTGTVVVFDPNSEYLHGVKMIKSGLRYTLLTSWDLASAEYSQEFLDKRDRDIEDAKRFSEKKRVIVKDRIDRGLFNDLGAIDV